MIGKIMSEASHSIIGMLSAKPLDMETRTANNEFSSLLLPGEEQSRSALDNNSVDAVEDNGSEQFLDQLLGNDDQPVPPLSDRQMMRAIAAKIFADGGEGDVELPSDTPLSPGSVSEIERFISVLQPSSSEPVSVRDDAPSNLNASTVGQQKIGLGDDQPVLADNSSRKGSEQSPILPNRSVSVDLNTAPIENRSGFENSTKAEISDSSMRSLDQQSAGSDKSKPLSVNIMATETAQKASAAKPYSDTGATALSQENIMNGKTSVALETPQGVGSDRKVRSSLDLRLASKGKVETSASRQAPELDLGEAIDAADKPLKVDAKSSLVEMESRPAAGHLEKNTELAVPGHSIPTSPVHNITQKTVSFDWNAPKFAERFAAEISDLTINGDLKKFEINPRNMGRLEVSLVARGSLEIIQIEAESDAARDLIVQHSQVIQDMLKSQGRSDLTLRVDVRENAFAGSHNDSMNFDQHDSADKQEGRSASSQNRGTEIPTESDADPQLPPDNSRYA